MVDRVVSVKLKADISDYTASLTKAAGLTKGLAGNVEQTIDRDLPPALQRSGDRAGGVLAQGINQGLIRNSPLIAAGVSAALAAGAPAALAGAAVLFGGIGAIAAAQTQSVRDAWTTLGTDIRDSATSDASVLVPVYEEMASKIGQAFQRMRPEIRDAFEASAPHIRVFTDGITGAAENALPGLVRAVERGGPVIDGLATLMRDVGTGLTGFLDGMSDNSDAAGDALEGLGDVLAEALPLLGELLGTGAEIAADVLPPLASALGVVSDVAAGLGPVLPAIVSGFVAMKVASTVAGGVSSLATSLTSFSAASTTAASGAGLLARALPMVALATAGLAIQQSENTERVDRYTKALLAGGDAAAKVRAEAENQANSGIWDRFWQAFTPDDEHDIEEDLKKAEEAVRGVGGAQTDGVRVSGEWQTALTGAAVGASTVTVEQAEAAKLALESWRTELQTVGTSFVEPLATYKTLLQEKTEAERIAAEETAAKTDSAEDSWRDYVTNVSVSLDEWATRLPQQLADQDAWRANIVTITQRGGLEVGQAFAAMGVEAATQTAQMAVATDAEFQNMAALIVEDTKRGGAGAAAELDNAMKMMAIFAASGGKATVAAISSQLGIGVGEVARIARDYNIALAGGINPILVAIGKKAIAPDLNGAASGNGKMGTYAAGGYTGDGEKFEPAGVVHRGEYVLTKERTNRLGVGTLENLERILPGYAEGGLVGFGRRLQGMGARVAEHPAFPPLSMTGHGKTSLHYSGQAIDVNTRAGTSALEQRELAPMAALARQLGFRTIFMSPGHYNHLHVDTGGKGGSIGTTGVAVPAPVVLPAPPSTAPFQPPISTGADAVMRHAYDQANAWVAENTAVLEAPSAGGGPVGAGVERWRGTVMQALSRVGQPGSYADITLRRMNQESGGNPRAINNWDVNAKNGVPSKGLMQVIDPTFRAWRDKGLVNDIWDPLANIVASMRYAVGRYGNLPAAYNRKGGYDSGGIANGVGFMAKNTIEPERVLSPRETRAFEQWMTSPRSHEFADGGRAAGGRSGPVHIEARVFIGTREITDIVRVEAHTIAERRDADLARHARSAL